MLDDPLCFLDPRLKRNARFVKGSTWIFPVAASESLNAFFFPAFCHCWVSEMGLIFR